MWWIIVLAIIAGLVVLGILLLSIPFDLKFQLEVYGKPEFHLRVGWLFGLLAREIKPRPRVPSKKPARRKLGLGRVLAGLRQASGFWRIKGLMRQFWRFIRDIFRCFKIRKLEADFLVGLDDPSETFYLFALTEPFNRLWNHYQPYPVTIRPSFIEAAFEGYLQGVVRVYPITLIPPMLRFHVFPSRSYFDKENDIGQMEKKQINIEGPVSAAGLTIRPVTQTTLYSGQIKGRSTFFGLKKPLYILVIDPSSTIRAFTLTGEAIALEEMVSAHPEIKEEIEKITLRGNP